MQNYFLKILNLHTFLKLFCLAPISLQPHLLKIFSILKFSLFSVGKNQHLTKSLRFVILIIHLNLFQIYISILSCNLYAYILFYQEMREQMGQYQYFLTELYGFQIYYHFIIFNLNIVFLAIGLSKTQIGLFKIQTFNIFRHQICQYFKILEGTDNQLYFLLTL